MHTRFECFSFNTFFEYKKIDKILPKCIRFLQSMKLNRTIRSISYDNGQILLSLYRIWLSLDLVSTNLKCVMDEFFKEEFTAPI